MIRIGEAAAFILAAAIVVAAIVWSRRASVRRGAVRELQGQLTQSQTEATNAKERADRLEQLVRALYHTAAARRDDEPRLASAVCTKITASPLFKDLIAEELS